MDNCHFSSGGGAVLKCVCISVCVWLRVNITNKDETVVSIWYTNSPTTVTQTMCDNDSQTSPKSTYSTTMSLWYSDDVRKAVVWPGCTEAICSLKGKHVYCIEWSVSVCWNMRACSCTIPADNRSSQQQLQAMWHIFSRTYFSTWSVWIALDDVCSIWTHVHICIGNWSKMESKYENVQLSQQKHAANNCKDFQIPTNKW